MPWPPPLSSGTLVTALKEHSPAKKKKIRLAYFHQILAYIHLIFAKCHQKYNLGGHKDSIEQNESSSLEVQCRFTRIKVD